MKFQFKSTNMRDFVGLADQDQAEENLRSQLNLTFAKVASYIPLTQGLILRPNTEVFTLTFYFQYHFLLQLFFISVYSTYI